MKKYLTLTFCIIFLFSAMIVSAGSNGNGGKDKIGVALGWPSGLSYSHEFNHIVEIDLTAFTYYTGIGFHLGPLFTVYDPKIPEFGNQRCPLSIGAVLGGYLNFFNGFKFGSFNILIPLRWEMNFSSVPAFNVAIDLAPLGFSGRFNGNGAFTPNWRGRFFVALRYRIP